MKEKRRNCCGVDTLASKRWFPPCENCLFYTRQAPLLVGPPTDGTRLAAPCQPTPTLVVHEKNAVSILCDASYNASLRQSVVLS